MRRTNKDNPYHEIAFLHSGRTCPKCLDSLVTRLCVTLSSSSSSYFLFSCFLFWTHFTGRPHLQHGVNTRRHHHDEWLSHAGPYSALNVVCFHNNAVTVFDRVANTNGSSRLKAPQHLVVLLRNVFSGSWNVAGLRTKGGL